MLKETCCCVKRLQQAFPLLLPFHLEPVSLIRGPVCLLQAWPRLRGWKTEERGFHRPAHVRKLPFSFIYSQICVIVTTEQKGMEEDGKKMLFFKAVKAALPGVSCGESLSSFSSASSVTMQ